MTKRVMLTEKMKDQVRAKNGPDVDFSKIVFYQARGISTEPIHQHTIYNKGILEKAALVNMLNLINDPINTVTVQVMHNQEELPTGKVFYSELVDEPTTGHSALYTLFGVSTNHPDIISDIDNGIIDEVSFGFSPKSVICSECGKDFMDTDVDFFDFIMGVCPNCGAVMGEDGAHVNIPEIESVSELSLVTRGAAKHPKILDSIHQMAMSDKDSPVITLAKSELKKELKTVKLYSTIANKEVDMNQEDIKAAMSAVTDPLLAEVKEMKVSLASLGEEKKTLETAKAALEEEKTSLSEEKAKLEADLSEANAEVERLKTVEAAFGEEIKKVIVAANLAEEIPEDLEGKRKILEKAHLTLASIPLNGVAKGADKGKEASLKEDFSVYKSNLGE